MREHVAYPLSGDMYYVRKDSAPTLLLSLGRTLARLEHDGYTTESVLIYPASDGDWVAHALYQDPDAPRKGVRVVARDDISDAERILKEQKKHQDQAEKQRAIERFKEIERQAWKSRKGK